MLLAWECLRRLLPERAALIAGVLFALHPIQSEAVDYVWARSIVLASLFCFAALWQWLEGRPWIAVAWFAVALLAKEECAAFPLLLVWLEWRGSLPGARQVEGGAGRDVRARAGCRRARHLGDHGDSRRRAGVQAGISPGKYLLMQGAVIWRYLQLVVGALRLHGGRGHFGWHSGWRLRRGRC